MIGAALGLVAGLGLVVGWQWLPARRRTSIADRMAPYLPRRSAAGWPDADPLADRVVTPFPTLERIAKPYLQRAAATLERILGGAASVQRRLAQAGSDRSVGDFRVQQVLWAAAAGGAAISVSLVALAAGTSASPVSLTGWCLAAAVGGVVACDRRLTASVRSRERRILAEFPTIADLLALAVAAGEGPLSALDRVTRQASGELAGELRRALGQTRTGKGLPEALDGVAERTSLAPLARFADGVVVALERGTPLAEVLRAQAVDVRQARTRSLMAVGGRKELLMMMPVVFLVLPVTVVFALYPGLIQISAIVP